MLKMFEEKASKRQYLLKPSGKHPVDYTRGEALSANVYYPAAVNFIAGVGHAAI